MAPSCGTSAPSAGVARTRSVPDRVRRRQAGDVFLDADAEDGAVVVAPAPDRAIGAAGAGVAGAGADLEGVGKVGDGGGRVAGLLGAVAELAPDVLAPALDVAVGEDGAGGAVVGGQGGGAQDR